MLLSLLTEQLLPFMREIGGAENATTENTRLENVAPCDRGGKCKIGKRGTILQGWKLQDWQTRDRFAESGKCKTGKRGNDEVWKAKRNLTT